MIYCFLLKLLRNVYHVGPILRLKCVGNGESFIPGPASESAELLILDNIHIGDAVFRKIPDDPR